MGPSLNARGLLGFIEKDAARALAAANKRVANILAKSDIPSEGSVDPSIFVEAEEKSLYSALTTIEAAVGPKIARRDYADALAQLATLREPVDAFFEHVMVNAEDPALRLNRYRLLGLLRQLFVQIADIALLTPKS